MMNLEKLEIDTVKEILNQIYKETYVNLKKFARNIIFTALGLKLDSWDRIKEIDPILLNEIVKLDEVIEVKQKLIETIKYELKKKLSSNNSKYISQIHINRIVSTIMDKIAEDSMKLVISEMQIELQPIFQQEMIKLINENNLIKELRMKNYNEF